jgi:hypothetical protein
MVAFMCLGFALLWGARENTPLAAGLALGVASSMKATAWPALAVAFALLCVRDGQRAAWRFMLVALSVVVVIVGPFAVLKPGALVKNTILFPLGLASVRSQASSPLLGHVLASTGVIGHTIVVVLLVGSGLAIAVSLVIRPPRDVPAATIRLVLGLSAMFVLAPSTRFGYFIYPAAMILWLLVSQAGRRSVSSPDPEESEALTFPEDPGAFTLPEDPGAFTLPEDPGAFTLPEDPGAFTLPEDPEDPKVLAPRLRLERLVDHEAGMACVRLALLQLSCGSGRVPGTSPGSHCDVARVWLSAVSVRPTGRVLPVVRLSSACCVPAPRLTASMEHRCCCRGIDGALMPFRGAGSGPDEGRGGDVRGLWCVCGS